MKIKKFLPLMMVSALTACGTPAAPALYDTTVALEEGGKEEGTEEERRGQATNILRSINSRIDFTKEGYSLPSTKLHAVLDVDMVGRVPTGGAMSSGQTAPTVAYSDFAVKGQVQLDLYHDDVTLPETPEEKMYLSSYVALNLKNFNLSVSSNSMSFGVNNLNVSLYYFYDVKAEDGYVAVDFSDPSVKVNVLAIVRSMGAPEQIAQMLDVVFAPKEVEEGQTAGLGGKVIVGQKEVATMLEGMIDAAKESGQEMAGAEQMQATVAILKQGDLVNYALSMAKSSMESTAMMKDPFDNIVNIVNATESLKFVRYETGANESGLVINLTGKDVVGESATEGFDFSLGAGMYFGTLTGASDVSLERLQVKMRVSLPDNTHFQGEVKLSVDYKDKAKFNLPDLNQFKDYSTLEDLNRLINNIVPPTGE